MEVRVLGPLEVRRDGVPVTLGARLQRALLTVLVLEGGRVVPADRLAELLWRGAPPPKTSASLHTTVAHLRRALEPGRTPRSGPSVIVSAAPGYRLATEDVDVDADRFERLLAEAPGLAGADDARALRLLDEALGLWRGPALAEFADEPFARPAADRLEALRQSAVELRAGVLVALGDVARAVAELQAHLGAHPLREQARASLARALYLSGRQAEALAVLGEGRRLLREELGLDPGPELRRLEQQILDHDDALRPERPPAPAAPAPPPAPAPAPVRLTGRDEEVALLRSVVASAAGGSGGVVLLTGDAGMGKTALLDALRDAVSDAGGTARATVCRDGLAAPPFWPVVQVVRAAAATLGPDARARLGARLGPLRGLVPDLGGPGDPAAGGVDPAMVLVHLTDALEVLLTGPDGGRPALLAVDDLHLADPATLQLLTGLAQGPDRTPLVLAVALRTGEDADSPALTDALATLGRLPRSVRIDLEPLPDDAVARLVRAAAPSEPGAAEVAAVVARAEGNPFYALELARLPADDRPAPGVGRPVGGVPAAVFDVLRQRVQRLPAPGEELLTALAVAGEPLAVDDVAAVSGVPLPTALPVLEAAVRARLAVDAGAGRFGLAHGLLADAQRASLSSARAALLHRALAERFAERRGADPGEAASIAHHHLAAAALDGGAAALPWLERAADAALAVSALDALRELSGRLLALPALATDPDRDRRELRARSRIGYVDVWSAGYDSPSIREYCRLVDHWTVPDQARPDDQELLWVAGLFQCQVGRLDDADRTAARMAALAGGLDDATATYLAEDMTAVVRWMQGRADEALAALDRAEAVSAAADLRRSLAFSPPTRIAVVRALALWHVGRRADARAQADLALRAAAAAGLGAAGFARRWALVLALQDGDPDRVRALVSMELAETSWERFRYPSAVVAFAEGWLQVRTGDRDAGLAAMRTAHAVLVDQGLSAGRSVFLGLLAEAALACGDPRQAHAYGTAGLAIGERGERFWTAPLERVRAAALAADPGADVSG
ncbi:MULTISPECIES: BTAD domain-containing putative transcriptional regulator [unclassified Geodermatophilus]|uniref:BTAD domain-containing putative transcriptional regulator n=1 Tax=unclassified Geodermatophilus TaxID=2637632 RepID=UPI003EEC62C3